MNSKADTVLELNNLPASPMRDRIIQLFENESQADVPDEPSTYAINAQAVLGVNYMTAGLLVVEKGGLLRIVQPGAIGDPNIRTKPPTPVLAHHYFTIDQIVTLVVVHPLKSANVDRPQIIRG